MIVRMDVAILLPEQLQRDVAAAGELAMQLGEIGKRPFRTGRRGLRSAAREGLFEAVIAALFRERP